MAATGRKKDSGRDDNWRNQFASTIKERNSCDYVDLSGKRLATPARSLAARLPATAAGGGARARVWHAYVLFSASQLR